MELCSLQFVSGRAIKRAGEWEGERERKEKKETKKMIVAVDG